MAVQKSRKTPSKRGHRRSHDSLTNIMLSIDSETGETHRRHHLTSDGYYKGKQIIFKKIKEVKEKQEKINIEKS